MLRGPTGATAFSIFDAPDLSKDTQLLERYDLDDVGEARYIREHLDAVQTGLTHYRLRSGRRQGSAHRHMVAEEIYVALSGSGRIKVDEELFETAVARRDTGRACLSARTRGRPERAQGPRLRVALSRRRRVGRRLVDYVTKPRSAPEPVLRFATAANFEAWLDANHGHHPGIWLEIAKKGSRDRSVTYADAIEIALCFGWIDGHKRRGDDEHWLQRFTPRSTRSRWSRINRDKAEQLIAACRMRPAGLTEIDRARVRQRAGHRLRGATGCHDPRRPRARARP